MRISPGPVQEETTYDRISKEVEQLLTMAKDTCGKNELPDTAGEFEEISLVCQSLSTSFTNEQKEPKIDAQLPSSD